MIPANLAQEVKMGFAHAPGAVGQELINYQLFGHRDDSVWINRLCDAANTRLGILSRERPELSNSRATLNAWVKEYVPSEGSHVENAGDVLAGRQGLALALMAQNPSAYHESVKLLTDPDVYRSLLVEALCSDFSLATRAAISSTNSADVGKWQEHSRQLLGFINALTERANPTPEPVSRV